MPNRRSNFAGAQRSQRMNRNYNTVSYVSAIKLGPIAHTVLVALMVTVLGLIYLTQATKATGYDYSVQEIDAKIAELSSQKSYLEVENAKLTALQSAKNSSVASAMTQPSEVQYAGQ